MLITRPKKVRKLGLMRVSASPCTMRCNSHPQARPNALVQVILNIAAGHWPLAHIAHRGRRAGYIAYGFGFLPFAFCLLLFAFYFLLLILCLLLFALFLSRWPRPRALGRARAPSSASGS